FDWTAGTLNLTTGDLQIHSAGPLGSAVTVGANKILNLTGGAQTLRVGDNSSGSLNITGGGAVNVPGNVSIADGFSGDGSISVDGAGSSLNIGGNANVAFR